MLAVAVAPTNIPKPKGYRPNRFTWNKEQAAQARAKSLETRRRKAIERKAVAAKAKAMVNEVCSEDPIASVEKALSLATKHGKAKAVESLASALAKLKRAGVGREPGPGPACVSYTPTGCSPAKSTHAAAPQSTQAIEYKPSGHGPDYAQYAQPLKESIVREPVGWGLGVGTSQDSPAHDVIVRITRRLETMSMEELVKLEGQISPVKPEPVQVGVQPVKSVVGVKPEAEMERFCVNGHWILGKRQK